MTTKSKRLSVYFACIVMPLGVVTTVGLAGRAKRPSPVDRVKVDLDADAAYRDGLFVGKLDGQQGRAMQPTVGRWNSNEDRASFRVGYKKGYREGLASRNAGHRR